MQLRTIVLSPHCGDTTSCIRQAIFVNFKGRRENKFRYLNKFLTKDFTRRGNAGIIRYDDLLSLEGRVMSYR